MRRAIAVAGILAGIAGSAGCGGGAGKQQNSSLLPPTDSYSVSREANAWQSRLHPAAEGEAARGQVRIVIQTTTTEMTTVDKDGLARTSRWVKVLPRLIVTVRRMGPSRTFVLAIEGQRAPEYFVTNTAGGFTHHIDYAQKFDTPSPGKVVTVRDASGNPVLLGVIPDWGHQPRGEGMLRDGFDSASGEASVRVGIAESSRTGRESMEFRMEGLQPGTRADLLLAGGTPGEAFVPAGSVPVEAGGRAVFRRTSRSIDPLPLGAASIAELHGRAFQVRVGAGTVVEGVIP